jgi:hypothetical protein
MYSIIDLPEEIRWLIAQFSGEYCMITEEYIMRELNNMIKSVSLDGSDLLLQSIVKPYSANVLLHLKQALSYIHDRSKLFPRQRSYNKAKTLPGDSMSINDLLQYELQRVRIIRSIASDRCLDDITLSDVAIDLFRFIIYHIHGWSIDVGCSQIDILTEGVDLSQAHKVDLLRKRVTFKYNQDDEFIFMLTMGIIDALIQQ